MPSVFGLVIQATIFGPVVCLLVAFLAVVLLFGFVVRIRLTRNCHDADELDKQSSVFLQLFAETKSFRHDFAQLLRLKILAREFRCFFWVVDTELSVADLFKAFEEGTCKFQNTITGNGNLKWQPEPFECFLDTLRVVAGFGFLDETFYERFHVCGSQPIGRFAEGNFVEFA